MIFRPGKALRYFFPGSFFLVLAVLVQVSCGGGHSPGADAEFGPVTYSWTVLAESDLSPEVLPGVIRDTAVVAFRWLRESEADALTGLRADSAMSLDPDGLTEIKLLAGRVTGGVGGAKSSRGVLGEPDTGHWAISHHNGRITGEINLLNQNRYFRIYFDGVSAQHILAEIDPAKIPVLQGADVLEFPEINPTRTASE